MKKKLPLAILLILLLYSCRTVPAKTSADHKDSISGTEKKHASSPAEMQMRVKFYEQTLRHPQFGQLKIQSRIDFESNGTYIPTLDATTYIEQGNKIWMNLSLYFYTAARGIATPEGIKAYSKLDRKYVDTDFSYLNKLLSADFIDYNTLQKILVGRTFLRVTEDNFRLLRTSAGYELSSIRPVMLGSAGTQETEPYLIDFRYSDTFDLTHVQIRNEKTKDVISIAYSNWEAFENYRMPKNVKFTIKGSRPTSISIENTKFENSKMQPPFSIPAGYSKMNF